MNNFKLQPFFKGAVASAICTLLIIISFYVPEILYVVLLSGLPIMFAYTKYGAKVGTLSLILAYFVAAIFTSAYISVAAIMLIFVLPWAVFGFTVSKGFKYSVSYFAVTAVVLIGFVVQLMLLNGDGSGIKNLFASTASELANNINTVISVNPALAEKNINVSDFVTDIFNTMLIYVPAFVIIVSFIIGYIIVSVSIFLIKRLKIKGVEYPKLCMLRAPAGTVLVYLIAYITTMTSDGSDVYSYALRNIMLIANAGIILTGFAAVDYFLSKKLKSGYVRAAVYTAVSIAGAMFISMITQLLFILGLFDPMSSRRIQEVGDGDHEKKC